MTDLDLWFELESVLNLCSLIEKPRKFKDLSNYPFINYLSNICQLFYQNWDIFHILNTFITITEMSFNIFQIFIINSDIFNYFATYLLLQLICIFQSMVCHSLIGSCFFFNIWGTMDSHIYINVLHVSLHGYWRHEYWNIVPRRNIALGCEPLITTFSLTNQHLTLFCVCFCLKTPRLIYIVDYLTLNSRPIAL